MTKRVKRKAAPTRVHFEPEKVLENWRALLQAMPLMTEVELLDALKAEAAMESPRGDVIFRLFRRYCVVKNKREAVEMAEKLNIARFLEEAA